MGAIGRAHLESLVKLLQLLVAATVPVAGGPLYHSRVLLMIALLPHSSNMSLQRVSHISALVKFPYNAIEIHMRSYPCTFFFFLHMEFQLFLIVYGALLELNVLWYLLVIFIYCALLCKSLDIIQQHTCCFACCKVVAYSDEENHKLCIFSCETFI